MALHFINCLYNSFIHYEILCCVDHCTEALRFIVAGVNVSITLCIEAAVIKKRDDCPIILHQKLAIICFLFNENLSLHPNARLFQYNKMKAQMDPVWCHSRKFLFFFTVCEKNKLQSEVCHRLKVWRRNWQREVWKNKSTEMSVAPF